MSLDDVRLGIEMEIPDGFQQHGARHDSVGVAHQKLEQLKLAGLQLHGPAAALDPALEQVQFQIAGPELPCGDPPEVGLKLIADLAKMIPAESVILTHRERRKTKRGQDDTDAIKSAYAATLGTKRWWTGL